MKSGTRKPPKWPTRYWHQIMRGWLVTEGYDYCYRCKSWKPNTKHHTCCECNRRMANDYYHSSHGLKKSMAWRKANKERVAVASKRFRESPANQERIRGYSRKHSRKHYLKLRSTPEGMDKLREQWRRADSKRRSQRRRGKEKDK